MKQPNTGLRVRYGVEFPFLNVDVTAQERSKYPQYIPAFEWLKTEQRTLILNDTPTPVHVFKLSDMVNQVFTDELTLIKIACKFPYGNDAGLPKMGCALTYDVDTGNETTFGGYIDLNFMGISFDPNVATLQKYCTLEDDLTPGVQMTFDMNYDRVDRKMWGKVKNTKLWFYGGDALTISVPYAGVPESDTNTSLLLGLEFFG